MKKIYLDVDEEITSVIDRLRKSEDEELALVVPKESALLQSVVNLKLIKREAGKLKKSVSVITSNKVGKALAENVGLLADTAKGEAKDEPKKEGEVIVGDKVKIDYKEEDEEVEPVAFKKDTLADEISIKEEPVEETQETSEKVQGESKDQKQDIASTLKNSKKNSKKKKLTLGIAVSAALIFIGLFIFGYVYLPKANIIVKVNAEKREFETDFTIDKNEPDTRVDKNILAGEFLELTKEDQKTFNATGKKNVGTKATGTMLVKNSYSTSAQTLVAGTRFQTGSQIFRSLANVDVPGYTDPGGGIVPGSANVTVEADDVGSQYNIGPNSFTIPGFSGSSKFEKIIGVSGASMTGGDSREVRVVTQEDFNKAKESFGKEVEDKVKSELGEKVKDGYKILEEATETKRIEARANPEVGSEGDDFVLTVKVEGKALSFKEDDLKTAYETKLKDEAGTRRSIVENGFDSKTLKVTKADLKNGTASLNIKSNVYFGTVLDSETLVVGIMGQGEDKAKDYLMTLDGVKEADISFWPSFLKRIPRIKSHITIKTEAVKTSENTETD